VTKEGFYITTPIYYVNDKPHIGHAYTSLACDVIARYMRLSGRKVKFLTGTDEHGQKVEKAAKKAGKDPKAFTDEVSQTFRSLANTMNFSYNDFIRTTEERHKKAAQHLWRQLQSRGHIYLDNYSGWYSVRDEAFYSESDLTEEGLAPTGATVEWVEEPSYFFNLSKWGKQLLKHYDDHPDFIQPKSRRNEIISFVKSGLKDLSISRTSFKWGVAVPGDERHVMYVWIEALTNYISALGYPDTNSADFKDFWPADIHVLGKDIARFHAVYWPAFLMAAGLPLPKKILAHGWWTNEGQKISKSVGNIIDPIELVKEFGLDQIRYFLMKEIAFGNDGNFARESLINRINSELANNIGNLVQRTLTMINKNCDGKVPSIDTQLLEENSVFRKSITIFESFQKNLESAEFSKSLEAIIELSTAANIFIDEKAPWKLKKENPEAMGEVLRILAEIIRRIALMLQAFTPDSASKMLDFLSIKQEDRTFVNFGQKLSSGALLPKPSPIFPKFSPEKDV
jgi:methionyl-tRNA synthetase